MTPWTRKPFGPLLVLLGATGPACGSDDSSSIQVTTIDGVSGTGTSAGDGGTSAAPGMGAATLANSGTSFASTCNSVFASALTKECTSDADCSLVDHNDCCGTVRIAIHKGTEARFTAAEAAFQSCVPCSAHSCFHPIRAEDLNTITMDGQAIFARCDSLRCTSVVTGAPACLATKDCALGQICVTFASLLSVASRRVCRSNPCASDLPTCSCAAPVCTGFGAGICSASGPDIICNDGARTAGRGGL
jgi:hypothetical protein